MRKIVTIPRRVCFYVLLCAGFHIPTVFASVPANDMFADRIPITGLPLRVAGDTTEATVEPEEPTELFIPGVTGQLERSVWWSWTATKSGIVGMYFPVPPRSHRALRIYLGSSMSDLTPVPVTLSPENSGFRTVPTRTDWSFHAEAGATYQIAIYDAGPFTLDLMERPSNDFFDDRIEIPSAGGIVFGTTTNSCFEPDEPLEQFVTTKSVWYSWRPDFSGQALVMLSGGNGTSGIDLFTGESVATLVGVASSTSGEKVLLPVVVSAGTTYSLRVSGRTGPELFRLSIGGPPTNDNFAAATLLSGNSAFIEGTTWGTTMQPGEPFMSESTATAWWKWIAPTNGLLRIKAGEQGTSYRYWVPYRLFTGTALSNLRLLGSRDGNVGNGYPDYYPVARGRTYYLRVQDTPFVRVEFDLFSRPVNDNFAQRIPLEGLSVSTQGDNHLATRQQGEPVHGGFRSGNSVWWTWRAPMSGYVFVNSAGSDFGNVMAAYTGDSLRDLELVADNRFTYSTGVLGFPVEGGVSYHLAVSGMVEREADTGKRRVTRGLIRLSFDLTSLMFSSPANGSVLVGPTNVTLSLNTPLEAVDGNIVSAEFYTPRHLWDPANLLSIGSAPSAPFSLTLSNLAPGIYVYSAAAKNHLGQLRGVAPVVFALRPPNDNFSESILLGPMPGTTRGWVGGASWEVGERRPLNIIPITGSSWWVWTAPETGQFRLHVNTPSSLVLYKGSALGALKTIAKFRGGENVFAAVGGETYHLQAYSSAGLFDDLATVVEFTLSR